MRNNTGLLQLMLSDQEAQPDIYRPGPYWQEYQLRIRDAILEKGIETFRSDAAICKGWADAPVLDPADVWPRHTFHGRMQHLAIRLPLVRSIVADYRKAIGGQFRRGQRYIGAYYEHRFGDWFRQMKSVYRLPDTLHGGCVNTVEIDGERYAARYVDFLANIHNFAQEVDIGAVRCGFEIGGGFGAFSHLLLEMFPNIRKHVYLDIPPMIYVATEYLRHFYGDSVVDYRETREMSRIRFRDDDEREILCLCPWQVERLDCPVDFFWNCASFSEMTPPIVANYAKNIDRVLAPKGAVCLVLTSPRQDIEAVRADQAITAFGPEYTFRTFEPFIEHERYPVHVVGRHNG